MNIRQEVPVRAFGISAFLCRREGSAWRVLLLLRANGQLGGTWCQVAGMLEAGETAWQAALREIREETGLVPDRFYSAEICEQYYAADKECVELIPVFVGFLDSDQRVTLNPEHTEYRWVTFEEAQAQVPFAG